MKYVYELAVANVRKFDSNAIDNRKSKNESFLTALRKTMIELEHKKIFEDPESKNDPHEQKVELFEGLKEDWMKWTISFIPDLYCIDRNEREVRLFEIEDTSPLTDIKLAKLIDFWWFMDNESWDVKCFVFDRYGHNQREINLQDGAIIEMGIELNSEAHKRVAKKLGFKHQPTGSTDSQE
jgi:hypothetical protein